jgi:Pyruvate/2-oxoacid:ferredoxin oxidoreductase delta subunit
MNEARKSTITFYLLALMALVVAGSWLSMRLWGGKPEKVSLRERVVVQEGMTLGEFGRANDLTNAVLKEVFHLASKEDLQKKMTALQLRPDQLLAQVNRVLALQAEHESKNWGKILSKFILWFAFLTAMFLLIRKRRVTSRSRKWALLAGVVLFGIILGSDPSPMGTVKDAIVLLGKAGVIFPPRAIALGVFLVLVMLANKFICGWGCQFGTLQDLIFRLNRDSKDRKGLFRQFKLPFLLTHTVRILFFAALTTVAFAWGEDLVGLIDPFKIYSPANLTLAGGIFIGVVAVASLFVYRPWCHLFCPFGLVGWLVEKVSIFRIKVNYDTCTGCEACAKACPTTAMESILKREKALRDCFSCATCIETCPTRSIAFQSGKRNRPPAGKFRGGRGRSDVSEV